MRSAEARSRAATADGEIAEAQAGKPARRPRLSVEENIRRNILSKGSVLYEEVEFLLREEFRDPRAYFPILSAIAEGNRKFGHIASQTGMDRAALMKYLSTLISLGIAGREVPAVEAHPEKSRKGLYSIADEFANFWLRFIWPNLSSLELGKVDAVWREKIRPEWHRYASREAERSIRQILLSDPAAPGLPFPIESVGRYWDKETEIDILAWGEDRKTAIVGEIKWSRNPTTPSLLAALQGKASRVPELRSVKVHFLVASLRGFRGTWPKGKGRTLGLDLSLPSSGSPWSAAI